MFMKALPALELGVAAGLATIYAAKLLTFVVWKARPWFRTHSTKLKSLEPEVEALYDYKMEPAGEPEADG